MELIQTEIIAAEIPTNVTTDLDLYEELAEVAIQNNKLKDALHWFKQGLKIARYLGDFEKTERFSNAILYLNSPR